MTSLVIVESPGKRASIQAYLDALYPKTYKVVSSVGHVCDLSKKNLGFNTSTFQGEYVIMEKKQKLVQDLISDVRRSDSVILATDSDREGEAIAAHLRRILNLRNPDRVTFNEITKEALKVAFDSPRKINEKLVDSQEVRRILDRMIGWLVSPLTRTYVVPDSSMGRVQTVVLLLLVELERRIRDFKSIDHFGVEAYMLGSDISAPWAANWDVGLWMKGTDQQYWTDEASASEVSKIKTLRVTSVETGSTTLSPSAPFITSTLQSASQKNLKFNPKKTMELAQKLYEAGAITYMRTDNPNLSVDAFVALSKYAAKNDLPIESNPRLFKVKGGAQQAHEAVRPTSFDVLSIADESSDLQKLYSLIWNRAVASQLKAAEYSTKEVLLEQDVQVTINGQRQGKVAVFKASGRKLIDEGWLCLTQKSSFSELDDEEEVLSNPIPATVKVGDTIEINNCQLKRKKTAPPKRFTAAALILKIEALGIGRPSTFATIIETVKDRDYISYVKDRIHVTERGMKIIEQTEHHFSFIDFEFTANMETLLDDIASGVDWFPVAKRFWDQTNQEVSDFTKMIMAKLPQHMCEVCNSLVLRQDNGQSVYWRCSSKECNARYADENNKPSVRQVSERTDFKCHDCTSDLIYRKGSFNGKPYENFVCSNARDEANPCRAKYSVIEGSSPPKPNVELYIHRSKFRCLACNRPVAMRTAKKGTADEFTFWSCTGNTINNPTCDAMYSDKNGSPNFELYTKSHEHKCPNCKKYINCRENKTDGTLYWKCSHKKCGWSFENLDDKPNITNAQVKYAEKCPECKWGAIFSFVSKSKVTFWKCTNQMCDVFMEDYDGKPDRERYEEKKKQYEEKKGKGTKSKSTGARISFGSGVKHNTGATISFKDDQDIQISVKKY